MQFIVAAVKGFMALGVAMIFIDARARRSPSKTMPGPLR